MGLEKIIVIPLYKTIPTENEIKSLRQCFNILGEFPICFICGDSLNIEFYQSLLQGKNFGVKRFNNKYFASVQSYNSLLLSLKFYSSFKKYTYMLVYQLDAWVFKNELDYWCAQGFAYIGAPWFAGWDKATACSKFLGIGNGGFSLRNIAKHTRVLHAYKYAILPKYYLSAFSRRRSVRGVRQLLKNILFNSSPYYKYSGLNEDAFWGRIASRVFKDFTLPGMQTALRFSVEVNPSQYVDSGNLPFGCHAWEKYEPGFWKKFIDA